MIEAADLRARDFLDGEAGGFDLAALHEDRTRLAVRQCDAVHVVRSGASALRFPANVEPNSKLQLPRWTSSSLASGWCLASKISMNIPLCGDVT